MMRAFDHMVLGMASWGEVWLLQNYNTRLVVVAIILLGAAAGAVGGFLLLRKRSLMGDALSHATLPGIGIAFALMVVMGSTGKHLGGLLLGAALAGLVGVAVMMVVRQTTRLGDDAAMGLVLSVFFGLGVVVMRMVQDMPGASAAGLQSFIYGKPASMVPVDAWAIAAVAGVVLLVAVMVLKELTVLCFDEGYARSQGWPVRGLDGLLLVMVTVVTVVGLQAVGLILMIALLITPASAARFWTNELKQMIVLAAVIGALSGYVGVMFSAMLPKMPAGAVIVLAASALFFLSLVFAPARGVLARVWRQRVLQSKVARQHLLRAMYEVLESEKQGAGDVVGNHPIEVASLLAMRSWTRRELEHTIRRCRARRDLEEEIWGPQICLSESGFGEAARITRNHRLWEVYLVEHADVAPNHVDRDADMVEHVLDAALVRRLEEVLQKDQTWVPMPQSLHGTKSGQPHYKS